MASGLLKIGLIGASFYYVAVNLFSESLFIQKSVVLVNPSKFAIILLAVFLLMAINWLAEAKKWQLLANGFENISLGKAFKAVLAGVSMDAVLPFGTGAISSKTLSLSGAHRKEVLAPVILAQGIQSFWTVVFGLIGITQLVKYVDIFSMYEAPQHLMLILGLAVLLIMAIWQYVSKNADAILKPLKSIQPSTWFNLIILSLIRYLVFLGQLFLLSVYLAPEIPVGVLMGCITWMFFAKTVVPKPGHLGALGIRGASVVFFLNLAGYAAGQVVLATVILWVINLAIPSLLGLFYIKNLNFRQA